jgi:DNA-binding MurR/RpiR family transcriptional regulator
MQGEGKFRWRPKPAAAPPPKAMKNPLAEVPRILKALLEREKEFGAFVRATRWGEGPLYFMGSEASFPVCLTGSRAFESLLGVPATARAEAEFLAYSLDALRPRSLVFVIPPVEDVEGMLGAARALRARGARLVALGGKVEERFGGALDDGVALTEGEEAPSSFFSFRLARHVAVAYLALVAARILKPPEDDRRRAQAELERLPEEAERTLAQSSDALRVFGEEVKKARRVVVAGGGRFFPVALEAARELEKATGIEALAQDVTRAAPPRLPPEAVAIVLSCSECRVRAQVHRWAACLYQQAQAVKSAGSVLSLTDAADRDLRESSRVVLLLPRLGEAAASLLQLAVAGAIVHPTGREHSKANAR